MIFESVAGPSANVIVPSTTGRAVDARDAFQQAHAAAQPQHDRFDLDDVAGMDRTAVAHALDAREEDAGAAGSPASRES